jgi:Fe-S oxidoreductase
MMTAASPGFLGRPGDDIAKENDGSMIGDAISEDAIWACTTCRACQEVCPVFVEPINKIIEIRRNLVLEQSRFPESAMVALKSIEQRGHPWRGTIVSRTDWCEDLDVKRLSEGDSVDVVFWVGCTAALEQRNMQVARSVAEILRVAGVDFAVMGADETCCGEPARRMGNEYLFQIQAEQNIATLKRYGVMRIVTACPHCYNTIKNEYPEFGGAFEVYHHTEFIAELLNKGNLVLSGDLNKCLTYHDSCYLGRYNGVYRAPRTVLGQIPGTTIVEMAHNGASGFCCGAGGGRMWMEEQLGLRINQMRVQEAMDTGADILVSACPFCIQMFEDAILALEADASLEAMDIAEIVAGAVSQMQPGPN